MILIKATVQYVNVSQNKHFMYTMLYPNYSIINKNDLIADIKNNAESSEFTYDIDEGGISIYSKQYPEKDSEPCFKISCLKE